MGQNFQNIIPTKLSANNDTYTFVLNNSSILKSMVQNFAEKKSFIIPAKVLEVPCSGLRGTRTKCSVLYSINDKGLNAKEPK